MKSDGELDLVLRILMFKIPIYPGKEKTVKLSDYKIKKFRKRMIKEGDEKKKIKKKPDTEGKKTEQGGSEKKKKRDIKGLLNTVTELLKVFMSRFGKHLHIEVTRLRIIVGSEDAATTAVRFGAVCGAVQCLVELMRNSLKLKLPKDGCDLAVIPDFTSEASSADIDITFSLRLWQIFDILIKVGIAYIKQLL